MRLTAGLLLALAGLAALALWASGGFQIIGWWVVQQQHAVQSALAGRIQALRAGEPIAYGVSLTDPCIGWDETETLLREAAAQVRASKRAAPAVSMRA